MGACLFCSRQVAALAAVSAAAGGAGICAECVEHSLAFIASDGMPVPDKFDWRMTADELARWLREDIVDPPDASCLFCDARAEQAGRLVSGSRAFICRGCAQAAGRRVGLAEKPAR